MEAERLTVFPVIMREVYERVIRENNTGSIYWQGNNGRNQQVHCLVLHIIMYKAGNYRLYTLITLIPALRNNSSDVDGKCDGNGSAEVTIEK